MALERKHGYVEGNTVRKIQPLERPEERRRPGKQQSRRNRQESVQYINIFYTFFLVAAACMVLWSCITYLQLQAESTSRLKNIAALETKLEDMRKENDDNYTRIITSVDLDYIKDVAVNELGMVYAQADQVILYDGGTRDYVRQSGEIPKEESSLVDQILGK
ncbi:MAG: cell division protein FtsL [Clostridiales bacterium]|nr:cell division protein FtsL [Clostridiales bacterium]